MIRLKKRNYHRYTILPVVFMFLLSGCTVSGKEAYSASGIQKTEEPTVYSETMRVITIEGNTILTKLGEAFENPIVYVSGTEDKNPEITYDSSEVNVNKCGYYPLTITVKDSFGEIAVTKVTVDVTELDVDQFDQDVDLSVYFPDTILPEHDELSDEQFDSYWWVGDSIVGGLGSFHNINIEHVISAAALTPSNFTIKKATVATKETGLNAVQCIVYNNPDRIVLMMGLCDIGYAPVNTFIGSYGNAIKTIQEYCPDVQIVVCSVLPIDADFMLGKSSNRESRIFNYYLAEMCERLNLKMVDPSSVILDTDGSGIYEDYLEDGVHLSDSGREKVTAYFRTHLPE